MLSQWFPTLFASQPQNRRKNGVAQCIERCYPTRKVRGSSPPGDGAGGAEGGQQATEEFPSVADSTLRPSGTR